MRALVLRLSLSVLGVSVLLLLLASLPVPPTPARSSSSIATASTRSNIITDTRWIELIRSGEPGPRLNRSTAALPTLNLHLTDNLIAGRASSPALIAIVVRRNNSIIVSASATPYPEGPNYFYAVQFYPPYTAHGGGRYSTLHPGDVISLTQAGASFTMTVPMLTAQVEAQADRVSGAAPVSGVVTIYLYSFADSSGPYTRTVDAGGQYQADYLGTLDVRPRDNGYVAYSAAPGRTTYLRCVAPFLRAQVGGPEISGLAAPLSGVAITVTDASHQLRFLWSGLSNVYGSFEQNWDTGRIRPGDRITATSAGQVFSMTVMTLTAQSDPINHLIGGAAPANQAVEVLRFAGPLCCSRNSFWNEIPAEQTVVSATVTGQYSATLAVTRPNYGAAIATAPDGNQTYARFAVPYLSARMSNPYWLTGQVNDVYAPVTITIQGPSGYFKDVRSAFAASDGYFADYASLTLDTGDVITVSTVQGVQAALQLPALTGQIDPVTDIVSGTAPPNARLTLTVYYYEPIMVAPPTLPPTAAPYHVNGGGPPPTSYTVSVTATAQGDYLVNLHGMIDLDNSSTGEVSLTTAEGHTVLRTLSLSRQEDCDYQLQQIEVGGNQVDLALTKGCGQPTYGSVRLRAANGQIKNEQDLPEWPWNPYFNFSIYFYTGTQPLVPVAIRPGDSVEVEWYNSPQFVPTPTPTQLPWPTPTPSRPAFRTAEDIHLVTIVVPTLTVQLNRAANIISGQALPGTTAVINLYRENDVPRNFTATVDAQGFYTVNLAADIALEAGNTARVTYSPIAPPAFTAVGVLPMVRVQLYQSFVNGILPPLSAYTATLQILPTVVFSYTGTAHDDGYFSLLGSGVVPVSKPGDTVIVTTSQQVLRLNVPLLTAHVDRASATVFGQAPPLARLRVEPYGTYGGVSQNVTATASGTYSATFPGLAPLNTTYGRLTYLDAEGDQAILSFADVHWSVVVNDPCWNGIVDAAGTPVTLTLRNDSGGVKSTLILTPTYPVYSACFTTPIQSGDQIFLQTASASEVFTVPVLSARHNYALQAIEGTAPPQHELFTDLYGTHRTYSDSSGHYGFDTNGLRLPLLSGGRVYLTDEAGNTTSIYFTVTGYQTFLPMMRR